LRNLLLKKLSHQIHVLVNPTTLGIIGFSLVIQLLIFREHLNDAVLSSFAPLYTDADEYVKYADNWSSKGFSQSFSDLWRMPGYPAVILLFKNIFYTQPYLVLRIFQIILIALSAGILQIILKKLTTKKLSIIGSLIYSIFPTWYFSTILYAEALTLCLVVFLTLIISQVNMHSISISKMVLIGILFALLIYLKPNNIILGLPIAVYMWSIQKKHILKFLFVMYLTTLVILAPWFMHISNTNPGFVGLTSTQGINLYIGVGMVPTPSNEMLFNSGTNCNVDPQSNPGDILQYGLNFGVEESKILTRKSFEIWQERPKQQLCHAVNKILIGFGILANRPIDFTFGIFNLIAVICAAFLYTQLKFRPWASVVLVTALVLMIQSAIFQADRRFVITVFTPFAILAQTLFLYSQQTNIHKIKSEFGIRFAKKYPVMKINP
jgi:hypothetical protein